MAEVDWRCGACLGVGRRRLGRAIIFCECLWRWMLVRRHPYMKHCTVDSCKHHIQGFQDALTDRIMQLSFSKLRRPMADVDGAPLQKRSETRYKEVRQVVRTQG